MSKKIVKQLMLVIPDPHEDINSKYSKDIIYGVFNSLLWLNELDNMSLPLDTILVFLDPDDIIESHVYSSINEDAINKLDNSIVVRNQYEIKDMIERSESLSIGDDGLQQARNYILANYIRNTHHQDRKNQEINYIEKHVHDLILDIGMLRKYKVAIEKNIFLFPIAMKEKMIKFFHEILFFGSQVSLDIVSDCDNAFRLASKKIDLVLIKEKISGSSGCYSPALLDTIGKDYDDKKNPIVYISMSLPSRSKNRHQAIRFMEYYNPVEKNKRNIIYLQICGVEKDTTALLSIIKEVLLRRKIYISYGNEDGVKINYLDDMEKQLRRYFPFTDIEIDKDSDRYMHDLHEYMERLKRGEIVITLVNRKYLYSPWAMDEMVGILESNNLFCDDFKKNQL